MNPRFLRMMTLSRNHLTLAKTSRRMRLAALWSPLASVRGRRSQVPRSMRHPRPSPLAAHLSLSPAQPLKLRSTIELLTMRRAEVASKTRLPSRRTHLGAGHMQVSLMDAARLIQAKAESSLSTILPASALACSRLESVPSRARRARRRSRARRDAVLRRAHSAYC